MWTTWTAYLKAHYPTEYMAALLTSQKDNKDKLAVYLGECRHMGITVLPPDVNASRTQFSTVSEEQSCYLNFTHQSLSFGFAHTTNKSLWSKLSSDIWFDFAYLN